MGNTRPLPQPDTASPGRQRPRQAGRARRSLRRAAVTLAAGVTVAVIGTGIAWIATPSASEATGRGQRPQRG